MTRTNSMDGTRQGREKDMIDRRNIENGLEIPSEGYCDEPYIVVNGDGSWTCTMTTGMGHEGAWGQHVVAYRTPDQGKTWSGPYDIEPADGPEASWVMPLLIPETGRIYAFYTYNRDNQREVKKIDGGTTGRVDSFGVYAYKFSDDQGRTWSGERYEIPMRTFACDRENAYGGAVQFFWGVGKPFTHQGRAYVVASKVGGFGRGFFVQNEGVLFASDNLVTEHDPASHSWQTLPDGDVGLRTPEGGGPIAGEFNVTPMNCGKLYGTYRTVDGYSCHAISGDGGHTWDRDWMTNAPGGRRMKNPRAANFVRRFSNGRYLYWYHFHGGECLGGHPQVRDGVGYESRNPVWLSGGVEQDGVIHWSQPEIIIYDDAIGNRISYPDFVEDRGRIFVSETQKEMARIHELDADLLAGLWNQAESRCVAIDGRVLDLGSISNGDTVAMPRLPEVHNRGCTRVDGSTGATLKTETGAAIESRDGFSLELWVQLDALTPWQILFDSRDDEGLGLLVQLNDRGGVRLEMSGRAYGLPGSRLGNGNLGCSLNSDDGLLRTNAVHQILFIVDGGPKIVSVMVDGVLCDGGEKRQFGWSRFHPDFTSANGAATAILAPGLAGSLKRLRIYDRYLLTSEGVANWNGGA
jgi:hypothetical protein